MWTVISAAAPVVVMMPPSEVVDGLENIGKFFSRSERWAQKYKTVLPLRRHADGSIFALRSELLEWARSQPRVE